MVERQIPLPIMSNDPIDRIMRTIRRYDPSFAFKKITNITDFPVADDFELLVQYLRGGAGPFIDLFLYVDYGVGWTLNPKGFSNSEAGLKAKELVEEKLKEMEFNTTMLQSGAFYEVLGRTCNVRTLDLNGDYYINKLEKCTGYDCINPMTLDMDSVRRALADTTGTVPYKQMTPTIDNKFTTVELEPERVEYKTKNPLTKYSPMGNSDLQRCITDLRTLARFPHYRNKLGRKYSEIFRVIEIDSEKVAESGEMGRKITEDFNEAQKFLDDTAEFYRDQEEKGGTVAVYNWEKVIDSSWAGKEVKIQDVELATLQSIAMRLSVPLPILQFAEYVNRDTLTTLVDTFISRREKGTRNHFYTPIIEKVSQHILDQEGITQGTLEVKYNKFLSKNLVEIADIISKLYPTQSISKPEIRELVDLPDEINLGGDEWKDLDPFPKTNPGLESSQIETIREEVKALTKETLQTTIDQFLTKETPEGNKLSRKEWSGIKRELISKGVIKEVD